MDAETMERCTKAAYQLGSRNHIQFINEALQVLRDPSVDPAWAPLEALRLLAAMQGTPYADRPEPRAALADVGFWLEGRLETDPKLSRRDLALELSWIGRLARCVDHQGSKSLVASKPNRFGTKLQALEQRRSTQGVKLPDRRTQPPPPPEETLADRVRRRFSSLLAAESKSQLKQLLGVSRTVPAEEQARQVQSAGWAAALREVFGHLLGDLEKLASEEVADPAPMLQAQLEGLNKPNKKDEKAFKKYKQAAEKLQRQLENARLEHAAMLQRKEQATSLLNWLKG